MTNPAPTNIKRLHGVRPSRINDSEPVPGAGAIEPPEDMDAEALAIWNQYAPDLIKRQVLTPWDVQAFGIWCHSVARYWECARVIRVEGFTVAQGTGSTKVHPLVTAQKGFADAIIKYGSRFGMTPSDRSQLSIGDQKADNALDAEFGLG